MDELDDPDVSAVLAAAERRARALADADEPALRALLHPSFGWVSHQGDLLDLEAYVASNVGRLRWREQRLEDPRIVVVGDTAVLRCEVVDVVEAREGTATFAMPMTQTWIRESGRWRLLAGHAGPRSD